MKNILGNNLTITLFGESHGNAVGAVLDGLAAGLAVDEDFIKHQLNLRRPFGKISTGRVEKDEFRILSGVFNGRTTGTPLCIVIPNENTDSKNYDDNRFLARPGHADYTAYCKYKGFEDYRGGGHFSGRITVALVAAAAVIIPALKEKGIVIGSHIKSLGAESDRDFADITKDIAVLADKAFAVLDETAAQIMMKQIELAGESGDSLGGVIETAVTGLPAGLGEPWFDTIEGMISHAVFSIPAVKGIQFGAGFDLVQSLGSEFNDEFRIEDGKVATATNNNGGINGGITNGMPVIFRTAVKPTPSIYKRQKTVNFEKMEDTDIQIQGRHDPAIVHRARVVVDSVTALVIADLLTGRYGTDYFGA